MGTSMEKCHCITSDTVTPVDKLLSIRNLLQPIQIDGKMEFKCWNSTGSVKEKYIEKCINTIPCIIRLWVAISKQRNKSQFYGICKSMVICTKISVHYSWRITKQWQKIYFTFPKELCHWKSICQIPWDIDANSMPNMQKIMPTQMLHWNHQ
jgi:hypothetical protein